MPALPRSAQRRGHAVEAAKPQAILLASAWVGSLPSGVR
jgi:hypothetical protein